MSHDHADLGHGAPVRIAAISLAVTAALLVLKLVLGLISGSIAVLSDAVDSGTDLAAGAAALISVRLSAQPADEEHPYGHGKVETISASVAATIVGIGGAGVALGLAASLGGTAVGLGRMALPEMRAAALPAHDVKVIRDVRVEHRNELRGFHRLRTRLAGAVRHVDMHLLFDPHLTITEVHPISDGIEREIEARLPGTICVIHVEPDDGLHTEEFDALVRERTGVERQVLGL